VAELQRKHGRRRLMEMLSCLEVHPVFTAHPTEARRRAVVTAIRRVGEQLGRLEDPRSSEAERRESMRRMTEEVDSLWRTGQLRSSQVTPLDEVRSIMAVFDETLFRVVPEMYRSLDWALGPFGAGWPRCAPQRPIGGRRSRSARHPSPIANSFSMSPSAFTRPALEATRRTEVATS